MDFTSNMGGNQPHLQSNPYADMYQRLVSQGTLTGGRLGGANIHDNGIDSGFLQYLQDNNISLGEIQGNRTNEIQTGATEFETRGAQRTMNSNLFGNIDGGNGNLRYVPGENGEEGYNTFRIGNLSDTGEQSQTNIRMREDGTIESFGHRDPQDDVRNANSAAAVAAGMFGAGAYSAAAAGSAPAATTGGSLAGSGSSSGAAGSAAASGLQGYTAPAAAGSGTTGGAAAGTAGAAGGGGTAATTGGTMTTAGRLASGAGAIAGYADAAGQPDSLTSTTSIDPSVRPFVQDYMQRTQDALGQGPNADQRAGYQMTRDLAQSDGGVGQAIQTNNGIMSGKIGNQFMGPNPHMEGMIGAANRSITDNYQRAIAPGMDANAIRAGTFGGSAWSQQQGQARQALAQQLSDNENQYRFQGYNQSAQLNEAQLNRQQGAASMAPGLNNARYAGADRLAGQGTDQFNQQQTLQNQYGNAVRTGMGIGSTQTSPNQNQSNPWASAMGGGLAAWQMYQGMR